MPQDNWFIDCTQYMHFPFNVLNPCFQPLSDNLKSAVIQQIYQLSGCTFLCNSSCRILPVCAPTGNTVQYLWDQLFIRINRKSLKCQAQQCTHSELLLAYKINNALIHVLFILLKHENSNNMRLQGVSTLNNFCCKVSTLS